MATVFEWMRRGATAAAPFIPGLAPIAAGLNLLNGLTSGSKSQGRANTAYNNMGISAGQVDWRNILTPEEQNMYLGSGYQNATEYRDQTLGDLRSALGQRGILDSGIYDTGVGGTEAAYHRNMSMVHPALLSTMFNMGQAQRGQNLQAAGIYGNQYNAMTNETTKNAQGTADSLSMLLNALKPKVAAAKTETGRTYNSDGSITIHYSDGTSEVKKVV